MSEANRVVARLYIVGKYDESETSQQSARLAQAMTIAIMRGGGQTDGCVGARVMDVRQAHLQPRSGVRRGQKRQICPKCPHLKHCLCACRGKMVVWV